MLILQHTIVSDNTITAEAQKSSKRSQTTRQPSMQEDMKKENKPDSSTAEVILFHGGCIV